MILSTSISIDYMTYLRQDVLKGDKAMGRPRRNAIEVLSAIIEKRQPLSLRDVRYYAQGFAEMREWSKDHMYEVIKNNFNVDSENKVTAK